MQTVYPWVGISRSASEPDNEILFLLMCSVTVVLSLLETISLEGCNWNVESDCISF